MPAWTDERRFYLPFDLTAETDSSWQYRLVTHSYGLDLNREPLLSTGANSISIKFNPIGRQIGFNVSIASKHPTRAPCIIRDSWKLFEGVPNGTVALEIADTAITRALCPDYILIGWLRANATETLYNDIIGLERSTVRFYSLQHTFLGCQSRATSGLRQVTIDSMGFVKQAVGVRLPEDVDPLVTPNRTHLPRVINTVLDEGASFTGFGHSFKSTWHNDSALSDFYNYLIWKATNSTHFLDPLQPPPTAEEMAPFFQAFYSKLAAIILGVNKNKLFAPSDNTTISGSIIKPETRIFMSRPIFIITEIILLMNIITSMCVYVRRPWRFLPRLPTSLASSIAFFAASHALRDMEGTAALSAKQRNMYIEGIGHRYGFGSFIGTDGKAYVGVERQPYFAMLIRGGSGSTQTSVCGSSEKGRKSRRWWSFAGWKERKYGKIVGGFI